MSCKRLTVVRLAHVVLVRRDQNGSVLVNLAGDLTTTAGDGHLHVTDMHISTEMVAESNASTAEDLRPPLAE